MAKTTVFQKLNRILGGDNINLTSGRNITTYNINPNDVLYSSHNKDERDRKYLEMKQQKLLSYQWAKAGYETSMEQLQGASQVRIMYRDADLMDAWPEIGAALDILSEESTILNKNGKMLNIYSKSDRIKSILEDLFINRLDIHVILPMIARATCKYGNEFMLLNIDKKDGVLGWKELPVYDIKRLENGMQSAAGCNNATMTTDFMGTDPNNIKFVWEGRNESLPYTNIQIAHFRLINDSLFLPYGVSHLNKARRHWRMLSMMEDAMLLYRLERSVERRIFKVNVGAIDDADVPAFLNDFMNNVKRAPVVDPKTGQLDIKKNFLDVSADYVIPVRNGQDPTNIETLQGAQNQTSMEDINYMENKVLSALKIPKMFLNFQDKDAKGQNMATVDIRFSRVVNKIQQALLMELNKIAIIHLYFLGFEDDLTNFSLSLNNPSNQLEIMEIDNLAKRLGAASTALSEQGGGIPLMSWHQVQKEIMGKTDKEIFDMLNEIRLERALATEVENTAQIIKRTGIFNNVDRIYGEPDAEYSENNEQGEGPEGGLGGGFGGDFGGDFGSDFGGDEGLGDLGEPGAEEMGDIGGMEGSTVMDENMPMESVKRGMSNFDTYMEYIKSHADRDYEDKQIVKRTKILTESLSKDVNEIEKTFKS